MTELYASLEKSKISAAETDEALAKLESEGAVMLRDHFCADPHLAGVDLRVVTLVEADEGEDPQLGAIRRIDEAWNKWLNEYLANIDAGKLDWSVGIMEWWSDGSACNTPLLQHSITPICSEEAA